LLFTDKAAELFLDNSYYAGAFFMHQEEFMYVGRIAAVGKTREDRLVALYRVSARSFPNRQTKVIGQAIAIMPKQGFEADIYRNPYIAYNCLRIVGNYAVVGNGSHTDPIAEKLETGMRMRDAIISVLYGMGYEHDDYNTPRIAAVVNSKSRDCALGIVRHDALLVENIALAKGEVFYIATYEHNAPGKNFSDSNFHVTNTEEACAYIIGQGVFSNLERPISAACAIETDSGFSVGYKDVSAKL
jgi:IMP cyclohydrolase